MENEKNMDVAMNNALTTQNVPETVTNPSYTPGFLRTQIGKVMRVEFYINNTVTDKVGRLLQVGASYIVLQSVESNSITYCDLYSIKFVTIVGGNQFDMYSSLYTQ